MSDDARLDQLIARHLDGRADAAELAELDAILRASPVAASRFVALARIDADLRTAHRATGEAGETASTITQRIAAAERQAARRSARRFRPRARRTSWLLPLAAGLLAAMGVLAWLAGGADAAPFAVAGRGVPAGTALVGTVDINGGGKVVLAAGSRAIAAGTAAEPVLRLDGGNADCTVAPRAEGHFAVATPHGEVRVIGTVFTVGVAEATTVTVASGQVEVRAGDAAITVGPGGQARIDPGHPPQVFGPVLAVLPVSDPAAWNYRSANVRLAAAGSDPVGHPVLRFTMGGQAWPWIVANWPQPLDWSRGAGVSVILFGTGSGRRIAIEVCDDGKTEPGSKNGRYARFIHPFADDRRGWHERRLPFSGFARRDALMDAGYDGLTTTRIHGVAVIGPEQGDGDLLIGRIGVYAAANRQ